MTSDSMTAALAAMREGHNVLIVVPDWGTAVDLWADAANELVPGETEYRDAGHEHIGRAAGGWIRFRTPRGLPGAAGYDIAIIDNTAVFTELGATGCTDIRQFPTGSVQAASAPTVAAPKPTPAQRIMAAHADIAAAHHRLAEAIQADQAAQRGES